MCHHEQHPPARCDCETVTQTHALLAVELALVSPAAVLETAVQQEMVQEQGKVLPLQLYLVWQEQLAWSS